MGTLLRKLPNCTKGETPWNRRKRHEIVGPTNMVTKTSPLKQDHRQKSGDLSGEGDGQESLEKKRPSHRTGVKGGCPPNVRERTCGSSGNGIDKDNHRQRRIWERGMWDKFTQSQETVKKGIHGREMQSSQTDRKMSLRGRRRRVGRTPRFFGGGGGGFGGGGGGGVGVRGVGGGVVCWEGFLLVGGGGWCFGLGFGGGLGGNGGGGGGWGVGGVTGGGGWGWCFVVGGGVGWFGGGVWRV